MLRPLADVPVTVVTGALGVGKTTAVLELLRHAPPGERWAVLVNEFGDVGIDGAVIAGSGGPEVAVREVAGGCICCTAGLELRVGLVRLLREVRPDRLIIEPSGVAHPASVIDALRAPGVREAVTPRAVITLVDPRQFVGGRWRRDDAYADQVVLADVLVANWADEVDPATMVQFREEAAALFPPKLVVAEVAHGRLDPAWLDLAPAPASRLRVPVPSPLLAPHDEEPVPGAQDGVGHPHQSGEVEGCGWVWPPDTVFDRGALEEALQDLVQPGPFLPRGVLRLKGVFRTPRVVVLVNATADRIQMEALNWRRDSRVEVLVPSGGADWAAVEARLQAAVVRG